jgi:hypothetical protein
MNVSGANCKMGSARSLKKALDIVRDKINHNTYPVFCIVTRERSCSIPWAYNIGKTRSNSITIASSAIQHGKPYGSNRPVHIDLIHSEEDARIYWESHNIF